MTEVTEMTNIIPHETKPWHTQIRAVLFDKDGLMVDSESGHYAAFKDVLAGFGIKLTSDEHIEVNVGKSDLTGARELVEKYGSRLINESGHAITPEELAGMKQARYEVLMLGQIPHAQEGLRQLLEGLRANGIKMAVASGSTREEIEKEIKALGLEEFFYEDGKYHFYSAEDVQNGKPQPDVFIAAARGLGFKNGECLVLEDSESGIDAARMGRFHSYAIPSKETSYDAAPHVKIGDVFRSADRQLRSLADVIWALRQDSPTSFQE